MLFLSFSVELINRGIFVVTAAGRESFFCAEKYSLSCLFGFFIIAYVDIHVIVRGFCDTGRVGYRVTGYFCLPL